MLWPPSWSDWAIVAIAAWAAIIAKDSLRTIVDQLKITKRAADAAKRSAEAATDSVKVARDSAAIALAQKRLGDRQLKQMEEQVRIARISADAQTMALTHAERAYINIVDWNPDQLKVGSRIVSRLDIKNTGRTPGHLISTLYGVRYSVDPPTPPPSDEFEALHGLNNFVTPGDSVQVTVTVNLEMTEERLTHLQAGGTVIWLFIDVTYRDVFQPDKVRRTRVARKLDPSEKPVLLSAPEVGYDYAD